MPFDHEKVSRANALRSLVSAPIAIGALATLQAEAEAATKAGSTPPSAVQYQTKPKGGAMCSQCRFYINGKTKTSTGACTQVKGPISPMGWCLLFNKGNNSSQHM